jgi:hypothetical protein
MGVSLSEPAVRPMRSWRILSCPPDSQPRCRALRPHHQGGIHRTSTTIRVQSSVKIGPPEKAVTVSTRESLTVASSTSARASSKARNSFSPNSDSSLLINHLYKARCRPQPALAPRLGRIEPSEKRPAGGLLALPASSKPAATTVLPISALRPGGGQHRSNRGSNY